MTIRKGVDDETVYQMVKAFWPALEKIRANAPWTRPVTIDYATQKLRMTFHLGADGYYKEIGKCMTQQFVQKKRLPIGNRFFYAETRRR